MKISERQDTPNEINVLLFKFDENDGYKKKKKLKEISQRLKKDMLEKEKLLSVRRD